MNRTFILLSLIASIYWISCPIVMAMPNPQECAPGSMVVSNCQYCSCDASGRVTSNCLKLHYCEDEDHNKKYRHWTKCLSNSYIIYVCSLIARKVNGDTSLLTFALLCFNNHTLVAHLLDIWVQAWLFAVFVLVPHTLQHLGLADP